MLTSPFLRKEIIHHHGQHTGYMAVSIVARYMPPIPGHDYFTCNITRATYAAQPPFPGTGADLIGFINECTRINKSRYKAPGTLEILKRKCAEDKRYWIQLAKDLKSIFMD